MKIAINTRFLIRNKMEGIGRFTEETLQRIVNAHPEHDFFFFFDRPYDISFVFASNVTPVVLFPPARHPLLFMWWFEWSVRKALKKYQIDVFVSPDNFLSLSTDVPTLLVVHDIAFVHFKDNDKLINRLYYQFFIPRFLKKAKHILTVSNFTKNDIIEHFNIASDKISVCYNGCRPIFQPLELNGKKTAISTFQPYFLYVGAIHPRKNVGRMIQAFDIFKKMTSSDVQLIICGRFGWLTGEVKMAFEQAEYAKDIIFKGYLPDAEVAELTAGAMAFVYVSCFEGFGIPILEAMYCDVPIITSNTSSMPEIAGRAALLVNPESVNDIAQAMIRIASDEHLRADLIKKGRQQRQLFSWEKTADIIYEHLEKFKK